MELYGYYKPYTENESQLCTYIQIFPYVLKGISTAPLTRRECHDDTYPVMRASRVGYHHSTHFFNSVVRLLSLDVVLEVMGVQVQLPFFLSNTPGESSSSPNWNIISSMLESSAFVNIGLSLTSTNPPSAAGLTTSTNCFTISPFLSSKPTFTVALEVTCHASGHHVSLQFCLLLPHDRHVTTVIPVRSPYRMAIVLLSFKFTVSTGFPNPWIKGQTWACLTLSWRSLACWTSRKLLCGVEGTRTTTLSAKCFYGLIYQVRLLLYVYDESVMPHIMEMDGWTLLIMKAKVSQTNWRVVLSLNKPHHYLLSLPIGLSTCWRWLRMDSSILRCVTDTHHAQAGSVTPNRAPFISLFSNQVTL